MTKDKPIGYRDFHKALYMHKEFGVEFVSFYYDQKFIRFTEPDDTEDHKHLYDQWIRYRFNYFVVAPESLGIYEPNDGDLICDIDLVYCSDTNKRIGTGKPIYGIYNKSRSHWLRDGEVIQRDDKPFIPAEVL